MQTSEAVESKQASKQTHYTVQCLSNRRQTTRVCCLLDRVQQMMILVHYIPRQRSCRRSPPQRIIKPNWSANPFNDATQLYTVSRTGQTTASWVSYSSRSTSSVLGRHYETVGIQRTRTERLQYRYPLLSSGTVCQHSSDSRRPSGHSRGCSKLFTPAR